MNKRDLRKLALLGLASGTLVISQAQPLHAKATTTSTTNSSSSASSTSPAKSTQTASTTPTTSTTSASKTSSSTSTTSDPNTQNMGYHLMTEDELLLELNDEGKKLYEGLDAQGKALALKTASQRCNSSNECKGLNACQTATNACAGKGGCKGKSKCAFSDKNLAVQVVAKKMADKRANL